MMIMCGSSGQQYLSPCIYAFYVVYVARFGAGRIIWSLPRIIKMRNVKRVRYTGTGRP